MTAGTSRTALEPYQRVLFRQKVKLGWLKEFQQKLAAPANTKGAH